MISNSGQSGEQMGADAAPRRAETTVQISNQSIPDVPVEKVAIYIDAGGVAHAERLRGLAEVALAVSHFAPQFLETPDQVDQETAILILQSAPAEALALAIEAGVPAQLALDEWRERTEKLLIFFRKNRRRAVIVEDVAFAGDASKALRQMGLLLEQEVPVIPIEYLVTDNALARILGAELLRRDEIATAIAGELEASAALMDLERSAADIEAAFARHDEAVRECVRLTGLQAATDKKIAELEAGLAEGQHEQTAILQQLFDGQAKWHEERQARDKAQGEREKLNRSLKDMQSMASRLKADLVKRAQLEEQLAEDKRLLEARIHQLGQGVESADAQLKAERSARAEAERERQGLAARVEELAERARQLEASEAERRALQKVRKTLEAELKTRFTELGTITAQLVENGRTLQGHAEELEAKHAELIASQDQVALFRGKLDMLGEEQRLQAETHAVERAALAASQEEAADLRGKLQQAEVDRQGHVEMLAAIRTEYASSQDNIAGQLQAMDDERRTLTERLEQQQQDLETRTMLWEQGEVERSELQQTLDVRFVELGAMATRLIAQEDVLEERVAELAAVRHDLAGQQEEMVRLRQQLADREMELNMIQASTSYRAMAPIRWLKDALGVKK